MGQIRQLMEDAFQNKVNAAYDHIKKALPKPLDPKNFDRNALQLGVLYELTTGKDFAKALYYAMFKLSKNPHIYDDVSDYGAQGQNTPATNQITWTGRPGAGHSGYTS